MKTTSLVCLFILNFVLLLHAFEGNVVETHPSHEVVTDHWAVELAEGADPDAVAATHGFVNVGRVGSLENVYLFQEQGNTNENNHKAKRSVSPHLSTSPHVSWYENQVSKRRFKRFGAPTDPKYADQWHLHNPNGVDVNVVPVWERGISGQGVTIAMVDDGLEYNHPDISPNYRSASSYDFNQGDSDPAPHQGDDHGTSAGGCAAAKNNNNVCGSGAAFNAGLAGIRLIADYTTDAQEASGLSYMNDVNAIYSNSWGPNDDGRRLEGPGRLTLRAMEDSVTSGRQGKGSIYVWAGGNGRAASDNCNYDGYANSRFTITIAAVDYLGKQAYYSESCAALLASAPSSGSARSITTSDLTGGAGTAAGDCTGSFGGTSAAAPIVAGVVALILEANSSLTWRDMQAIIVNTSKITDANDADWVRNGAGYHVNHKYGYGLIDASAAVALAINWPGLPRYRNYAATVSTPNLALQDNRAVSASVDITGTMTVEAIEIIFSATHPSRGDLQIILTSPAGTQSVLAEIHNDRSANYNAWTFVTMRCWGESIAGRWTLEVIDKRTANTGTWTSWQLKAYGH